MATVFIAKGQSEGKTDKHYFFHTIIWPFFFAGCMFMYVMGPCSSEDVLVSFLNSSCVSPCTPFSIVVQEHIKPLGVHT